MASDDFYLVLPSNASMTTHPNNTLAQYITNLPRRISLSGDWECGLTEIHYPHDWYNVRNARLTVEHGDKTETDAYFEDGYYDSAKTLVRALNDELKGGRVKFAYEPVTQKVTAHMKGDTTFAFLGSFVGCARLLHRRFEAWFRIALRLFEHRRTAHRRRQDCTTATNSADNRTTRGNGGGALRSRPVHARAESRI